MIGQMSQVVSFQAAGSLEEFSVLAQVIFSPIVFRTRRRWNQPASAGVSGPPTIRSFLFAQVILEGRSLSGVEEANEPVEFSATFRQISLKVYFNP